MTFAQSCLVKSISLEFLITFLLFFSHRQGVIELGDVTPHNIKLLRRLNQVIFPVSYNDKFYKDVLESGPLAKLGKDLFGGLLLADIFVFISF